MSKMSSFQHVFNIKNLMSYFRFHSKSWNPVCISQVQLIWIPASLISSVQQLCVASGYYISTALDSSPRLRITAGLGCREKKRDLVYIDLILYLKEKQTNKQKPLKPLYLCLFIWEYFSPRWSKFKGKKKIVGENTVVDFYCHGQWKNVECELLKDCIDQSQHF